MTGLLLLLLCAPGQADGADKHPAAASFLYQPAYVLDEDLRLPAEPYQAQPGDILLCTDRTWFWKITFSMAFAGHPHHFARRQRRARKWSALGSLREPHTDLRS